MAISAKEAVQAAFDLFDEFVAPAGGGEIRHKLLEELKLEDGHWRVVVGFDLGREKTSSASRASSAFYTGLSSETSPIREYRTFKIDKNTGEMIELS